jgi:hypothetical protein
MREDRIGRGRKSGSRTVALQEESGALLADHLKGQVHDQLAVVCGEAAEKLVEAPEEFRRFAGTAPRIASGGHARREGRGLGRRFPIVEELVHGNFEGAGHFFQRLDARDGVAVLDTRDVAAFETGAFLDVPLRKVLLFPDGA